MATNRRRTIQRAEGNPSRMEQLRAYNDSAKQGFYTQVYDPYAAQQWQNNGGGIAGDPRTLFVDTPKMNAMPDSWHNRGLTYTADDIAQIDRDRTASRDPKRIGALRDFLNGLKAQQAAKQKTTSESLFGSLYDEAGIENAIREGYGAQTGAINSAYGAAMGRIGGESASATAGVQQEGSRLMSALSALGLDANDQFAASRKAIVGDYQRGREGVNAETANLMRDLAANGGGAGQRALGAQAGVLRAASKAGQTSQVGLNDRYSQLMAQELNNRQAAGQTITTGNIGDIARVTAQARADAETQKAGQLAQVGAGMAGDLAGAKADEAKAKYSFAIQAMQAQGAGSGPGGTLSPTERKSLEDMFGQPNYSSAFKGVLGWKDPDGDSQHTADIQLLGNNVLNDLAAGKSPRDVLAAFKQQAGDAINEPGYSDIQLAINSSIRQAAAQKRKQKLSPEEKKYAVSAGYLNT